MLGVFGGREKEELNKKLLSAQQELEQKNSELAKLKGQIKDLQLSQKNLKQEASESVASAAAELVILKKDFSKLQKENQANYESFLKAKETREKLKLELEEARNGVQKDLVASKEALKSKDSELSKLTTLQANFDKVKAESEDFRVNNEINYKNYLKIAATQKRDLVKIKDLKQEKELLLLQINEASEESNKYFLELKQLQAANQSLSNQIKRLTAGNPNYVDYGGIEIVTVDTVSETPQILWKITDYSAGAVALPEFYFRTSLQDGLAGIGLVQNPKQANEDVLFVPQLINKESEQLDLFKGFSGLQWNQIQAACTILSQLLKDGGRSLNAGGGASDFDLSFWQSSFLSLIENIRRLPQVFRYEKIKLKRELQNPDYEHLWLEFHDVTFGDFKSNKFELRIGASMIDRNGFSLLPKLEFPLVDGKHKPFESWFAESGDDFGQKFELRFSLEKQIFDVNTFQRLNVADQKLVQVLSFVLPSAINKLIKSRVSIHRPWATWSSFINETVAILLNLTRGLQTDSNTKAKTAQEGIPADTVGSVALGSAALSALGDPKSSVPTIATSTGAPPEPARALGRRMTDVVAAGRRKSDMVAATGGPVTATARFAGVDTRQFVEAPTKLLKRKSVSVLVAKSPAVNSAASKPNLRATPKTAPKSAGKKTKMPAKAVKTLSDHQHVDPDQTSEQVGMS